MEKMKDEEDDVLEDIMFFFFDDEDKITRESSRSFVTLTIKHNFLSLLHSFFNFNL
jgi:hypothetical protein